MTSDVHVRASGLYMQFGSAQVLRDLSFEIRRGEIAVVIGGSGSGKTTLLRILIGLLRPTAGAVYIDGENIAQMSERALQRARAKWAMVFQYSALLDSLSVLENVTLPLEEHQQLTAAERRRRGLEILASLELQGTEDRYPNELSGGMRKRVALARALIRQPSLIVYDEPASGLDPLTARLVDDLILRTRDRFGVTSIVISHDMAQTARLADRVYVIDRGELAAQGDFEALQKEPGSLAARFFEASRIEHRVQRPIQPGETP
jgi:phospholipid/cholesterol/gamma-HCH transport system ATP-binding protein